MSDFTVFMYALFVLLVIMQFKHLVADYFLQGKYMLGKFKDKGWVLPLAAHCGVHFLFTFIIALLCSSGLKLALLCGIVDFTLHFIMDRIKASPKLLGRFQALSKNEMMQIMQNMKDYNPEYQTHRATKAIDDAKLKSNVWFWWSLGIDQTVHHLTDLLIVAMIVGLV